MDRAAIFRILQVAVVAPWIYHISNDKANSPYFRIGLKLVAGSIIALNAKPVIMDVLQASAAFEKVKDDLQKNPQALSKIIEGEYEQTP